jgi:hypothetical protein
VRITITIEDSSEGSSSAIVSTPATASSTQASSAATDAGPAPELDGTVGSGGPPGIATASTAGGAVDAGPAPTLE